MLVQYTQQHVVIPHRPVGDLVNIEVDAVSKYVERSMAGVFRRLEEMEKRLESLLERDSKRQKTL